jgi:hypothetical protein
MFDHWSYSVQICKIISYDSILFNGKMNDNKIRDIFYFLICQIVKRNLKSQLQQQFNNRGSTLLQS